MSLIKRPAPLPGWGPAAVPSQEGWRHKEALSPAKRRPLRLDPAREEVGGRRLLRNPSSPPAPSLLAPRSSPFSSLPTPRSSRGAACREAGSLPDCVSLLHPALLPPAAPLSVAGNQVSGPLGKLRRQKKGWWRCIGPGLGEGGAAGRGDVRGARADLRARAPQG